MKDELRYWITKQLPGLWLKTYSYLEENNGECKKTKGTKNVL